MSTRKIKLKFPNADTPGFLEWLKTFPVHVATLERFMRKLAAKECPTEAETDATAAALVAFALDEPDKEEAKRAIMSDLSLSDIARAVKGILDVSQAELAQGKTAAPLTGDDGGEIA